MKNKVLKILSFALFCLAVIFGSCSSKKTYIYGDISGMPDHMVYLSIYEDGVINKLDSVASHSGRFKVAQPKIIPGILQIQFEGYPDFYLPVIVDGKDVYINGNFNYANDIVVSGTPSNDDFREYRNSVRGYDIMLRALEISLAEYRDSVAIIDSTSYQILRSKNDSITQLIQDKKINFIGSKPSSIISAMLLSGMITDSCSLDKIDTLVGKLDSMMIDNVFLQQIRKRRDALGN